MHSFKEEIYEKVQDIEGSIVKEYPTNPLLLDFKNAPRKLKMHDVNPDMVIVDYGDLLRPVSGKMRKDMNWNLFMKRCGLGKGI